MKDAAELTRHIKSITQTRQITNAMFLTSSSKMRKALKIYAENRAFTQSLAPVIKSIIESGLYKDTPVFSQKPGTSAAYIIITSDQGLAGPYNADVLNLASGHMIGKNVSTVFPIGGIGVDYFSSRSFPVALECHRPMHEITVQNARYVSQTVLDMMDLGQFDEIYLVYTAMRSAFHQHPALVKLLPLRLKDFAGETPVIAASNLEMTPGAADVIKHAVKLYTMGTVYGAAVQSYAAEQCLRMQTMDTATRNADDMLDALRIELNRSRQEAITQEITEIVSGYLTPSHA